MSAEVIRRLSDLCSPFESSSDRLVFITVAVQGNSRSVACRQTQLVGVGGQHGRSRLGIPLGRLLVHMRSIVRIRAGYTIQ